MKIQLIQNLAELDGGEFLEIFPGPYKGRSWNENSAYVEHKAFALFEPIIKKHAPQFDHRSNTAIPKESWVAIIADLQSLRQALADAKSMEDVQNHLGCRDATSSSEFNSAFQQNVQSLTALIDNLVAWLNRELESQPVISVLGI